MNSKIVGGIVILVLVVLGLGYYMGWFGRGTSGTGSVGKKPSASATDAKTACIQLCQEKLEEDVDLNDGPCLSDEIAPDWVCDVAHNPRQAVDNDPANQCPAYIEGATHYFVEVDPECDFINPV